MLFIQNISFFRPTENRTPSCIVLFYSHRRYGFCMFTSFDEERVRLFPLHVDFRYQFIVDVPDDVAGGQTCDLKKKKPTLRFCSSNEPMAIAYRARLPTWQCFINKQKTLKIKKKKIVLMYVTTTAYDRVVVTGTYRIKAIFLFCGFRVYCRINVRLNIRCRYD